MNLFIKFRIMNDNCQVCELLANGSHYTVHSYACKEFFRRSVKMLRNNKILEQSTIDYAIVTCKIIKF